MMKKLLTACLGLIVIGAAQAEMQLDIDAIAQPHDVEAAQQRLAGAVKLEFHAYARERPVTHNLDVEIFGRIDHTFEQRDHLDVREFIYAYSTRDWSLRAGMGRVFWGVTESVHVVDVVNQSDFLEDIDGEDKLGQAMLALAWNSNFGLWDAYWLPHQRARQYPGQILFPSPFPVAVEETIYESPAARQQNSWALRWYKPLGFLDVAASVFKGMGREPRLLPCAAQGSGRPGTEQAANCDLEQAFPQEPGVLDALLIGVPALLGLGPSADEVREQETQAALADVVLVPHYDDWLQYGLELQANVGNWAWKFEGRRREAQSQVQHAAVAGFEYSHGAAFGGSADLGYLMEYLYDERKADPIAAAPFANDLLLGLRVALNDVQSTQLLGGMIVDLDHQSRAYSLELSRRIGGAASVALEMRIYSAIDREDSLKYFENSDQIRFTYSLYL